MKLLMDHHKPMLVNLKGYKTLGLNNMLSAVLSKPPNFPSSSQLYANFFPRKSFCQNIWLAKHLIIAAQFILEQQRPSCARWNGLTS